MGAGPHHTGAAAAFRRLRLGADPRAHAPYGAARAVEVTLGAPRDGANVRGGAVGAQRPRCGVGTAAATPGARSVRAACRGARSSGTPEDGTDDGPAGSRSERGPAQD